MAKPTTTTTAAVMKNTFEMKSDHDFSLFELDARFEKKTIEIALTMWRQTSDASVSMSNVKQQNHFIHHQTTSFMTDKK